ncbi:flagellar hook-basal body complex protein FliE [Desulfuribacillus alkaliarsenatis]|uniref:Flagellar hook-basal body complex protein FliE n=1 Tax=Desulfuribacillus alkaliarsenatis TaxID=766136 RepID=A0A1E5G617_9FIRM|nr:flagellar hook-basal body complex protein FliE [Desulfuribacillus alkaliarsenatis]OEF98603.1 flagellar hook-basal body complex protein FliE [Desulfuribacillus alkaliarsenatis]
MVDKLNGLNIGINQLQRLQPVTNKTESTNSVSFGDTLKQALNQVNKLENESSKMGKLLAAGKIDNLHDVVIAGQKASIAVELTVQVRNKAVEAYQEVMRMQV